MNSNMMFPAELTSLSPLAEWLILRAVDFFDVEMNAGKNITTLIKALPDPAVNYSTDKNGG